MADINLLPDDLRKKEDVEKKTAPKPSVTPFTWREPTLAKPAPITPPPPSSRPVPPPPLATPVTPPKPPSPPVVKTSSPPSPERRRSIGESSPLRRGEGEVKKEAVQSAMWWTTFVSRLTSLFHRTPKPQASAETPKPTASSPASTRLGEAGEPRLGREAIGVNLITEAMGGRRESLTPTTHIVTVAAIALGSALTLIIGIWLVLKVTTDGRMKRAAALDEQVAILKRDVTRLNTVMKENENFITRVRVAKQLLDTHVGTKNLFALLEGETIATAQFSDVFIRPSDRHVSLSMMTLDVQSLVAQLVHWARLTTLIEKVDVTSMTRQERPEFVTPVYSVGVILRVTPAVMQSVAVTP